MASPFQRWPFAAPERIGGGALREPPYPPKGKVHLSPVWQENRNSESAGGHPTTRLL